MRQIVAPLALALVVLVGGACGSGASPPPECQHGFARLVASTVDHEATIADVKIQAPAGGCLVSGACRPGAGLTCSAVTITAPAGTPKCELTFVSIDGASFSASAAVHYDDGAGYKCTSLGQVVTAHGLHFEPGAIDVDFSKADGGDGPP